MRRTTPSSGARAAAAASQQQPAASVARGVQQTPASASAQNKRARQPRAAAAAAAAAQQQQHALLMAPPEGAGHAWGSPEFAAAAHPYALAQCGNGGTPLAAVVAAFPPGVATGARSAGGASASRPSSVRGKHAAQNAVAGALPPLHAGGGGAGQQQHCASLGMALRRMGVLPLAPSVSERRVAAPSAERQAALKELNAFLDKSYELQQR